MVCLVLKWPSIKSPGPGIRRNIVAYEIDFGEYFLFEQLTLHLTGLAEAFPALVSLESLAQSWRGRDIW